jgi:hypothetical protein
MPRSPNLASSQLDHLLTTSSAYSEAGLALRPDRARGGGRGRARA